MTTLRDRRGRALRHAAMRGGCLVGFFCAMPWALEALRHPPTRCGPTRCVGLMLGATVVPFALREAVGMLAGLALTAAAIQLALAVRRSRRNAASRR